METKQEIKLEPVTHYYLTPEELKTMYIYLALSKYSYLRHPNYNEPRLLELLKGDFKQFQTDIQLLMEKHPNDHSLHRIHSFFVNHNKNLNMKELGL